MAARTTLAVEEIQSIYTSEMVMGFQKMRQEGTLCDSVLVCGTAEFPVHRAVLCVGSPYFKSLLTQMGNLSSRIELPPPVEPAALEIILTFLYTGSLKGLEMHVPIVPTVLKAAEFFQLTIVYEYCWNLALSTLTAETFCDIWCLSQGGGHQNVVPSLMSFAVSNFDRIIETGGFLLLLIPQFRSLLQQLKPRLQEPDVIVRGILNWINANIPDRQRHLAELFGGTDLRSLSSQYLRSLVTYEDIIKTSPETYNRLVVIAMDRLHIESRSSFKNLQMITFTYDNERSSEIRQFNLETQSWLPTKTLPVLLTYGTVAASLHGYIYFCGGGREPKEASDVVEIYNIEQNTIFVSTKMAHRRFRPGVTTFQSQLYVVGGDMENGPLRNVERYDPATCTWSTVAPTCAAHSCPNAVSMGNYLYVVGSWNCCNVERYDATTDAWTLIQGIPLPTNHIWPSVTISHGKIYVVKNINERQFYVFDPSAERWSCMPFGVMGNIAIRDMWPIINDPHKPIVFVLTKDNELFSFNSLEAKMEKCVDAPFEFAVKRVLTLFAVV